jgi:hypothetical protein
MRPGIHEILWKKQALQSSKLRTAEDEVIDLSIQVIFENGLNPNLSSTAWMFS